MTKILAIISTHGNELLGPNVLSYMLNKRSELLEYVDFMVANPRAYSQNVRYVESDLNRSYGSDLDTYEARRSKAIEDRIKSLQPELVLDFRHCTFLYEIFYINSPLLRRISLTNGNGVIFQRLEVDNHAVRRTNFILAAIALTDVSIVVPHNTSRIFLR